METHSARQYKRLAIAMLALGVLALTAMPALANSKHKYTLGAGLANESVSGGLDGNTAYFADPTFGPFVYPGKLASGTGGMIMGGVTVNKNVALEALFVSTSHDATSPALPGKAFKGDVSSLLLGMRLMYPVSDSFELFGRGALGVYTVDYDHNTQLPPSPLLQQSSFSGVGLGLGGGIAFYFDPLGLELGVLAQHASLNKLSAGGVDGDISGVDVNLLTATLAVTVSFGAAP